MTSWTAWQTKETLLGSETQILFWTRSGSEEIFRIKTVKNSGRSYLLVHLLRILVTQGSSTPRGASCYHANHWWRHFLLPRATLTVNFVFKHGVRILESTKAITDASKTCSISVQGWFSLAHKHKHKHKHNISISKWEHPRHKHKHKQKNEPTYLSYAVFTCA